MWEAALPARGGYAVSRRFVHAAAGPVAPGRIGRAPRSIAGVEGTLRGAEERTSKLVEAASNERWWPGR